jgi:hypothetical protein
MVLGIAAVALLVGALVGFPFVNGGGEVVEVTGTVVGPFEWPNDGTTIDVSYYMRVALDSGPEVRVPISRSAVIVPGRAVVLASREGRLGATSYSFRRYVE